MMSSSGQHIIQNQKSAVCWPSVDKNIFTQMISVAEAQNKILETVKCSVRIIVGIEKSSGCVISENIFSPLDLPPFDQSAMDGYAIVADDFLKKKSITITGESAAGKNYSGRIKSGQAIRIFTGAQIPPGADAVVMQEKVSVSGNEIVIADENFTLLQNIRRRGSQIRKKELALEKNTVVTPAGIGFLASMGLKTISVYRKPVVVIIVTGNELQSPGSKLLPGKIYESNALTLSSALKKEGTENIKIINVRDDETKTRRAFLTAMKSADFILFSGGISVGDYDFVGTVLKTEKVKEIFYKVKQKPGKPLYFGMKNKKYIFGLPGNPASVLTCFYEYVIPAIRKFSGYSYCFMPALRLPLSQRIQKKKGLTQFLKAITDFKTVTPLEGQESYIMRSYAEANCLVCIQENDEVLEAGKIVDVHII
jgi:molybdopterin molybdotransferase